MQRFSLPTLDQLPELLRAFRRQQGLTQAQAAQKLGVTQQVYSALERDPSRTSVGRLYKLLSILDVTVLLSSTGGPDHAADLGQTDFKSEPSEQDGAW